jgi:enoyl-CoA hydratase/carnithine racemase
VAVLTIDNVARRNAVSDPVKHDLSRHLNELSANRKCRAIVLTGAGGFFSAGGDVKSMKERGAAGQGFIERRLRMGGVLHSLVRVLVEGPKPVVTAVEGFAYGAGLALAMASDWTVVAKGPRVAAAPILRGLAPDGGLYYLLAARTNPGRARELLLSGRTFGAEDALNWGVAHELVDQGQSLDAAVKAAERLASVPPLAYALTRAAMTHSYHTLEACFRAEQDYQPVVGLSKDHKESVAAFLEKRKPVYTGE